MSPEPEHPHINLENALREDDLQEIQRAYYELEAYQLSTEHQATKERLKQELSNPRNSRRTPLDSQ